MKPILMALLVSALPALLVATLSAATTEPATAPTSAPATAPATIPATAAATTPAATLAPMPESRFSRGNNRSAPSAYDILDRKSIFSKDRTRPNDRPRFGPGYDNPRPQLPPVFIGSVLEDTGYVGFIEKPDSGQLLQVRRGDKLPNNAGTVADLSLDYLDIAPEGDTPATPRKRIDLGQNLLGAAPAPRTPSTEPSAAADPTATTAPAASGSPDDLIERLRRRRQQELGK